MSGQVQKFTFKEEDIVNTFDLNSMYAELKKDKRFKEVAQPATSTEETKKDKWNHGAEDTHYNIILCKLVSFVVVNLRVYS